MIEAAVVGLGRIGAGFQRDPLRTGAVTHAGAWARHPAATLAAGVDPDPKQRKDFEEFFGVPSYPSWTEASSRHSFDVVSVCTPPSTHRPVVNEILDDGVARVICEKPCTDRLDAARDLLNDLGGNIAAVGVNFTRRYDPLHRYLLGSIAAEGVTSGTGHYTAGLKNTGSHWIDGLHSAGAWVEEVFASPRLEGADPTPDVSFRLSDGGLVHLMAHDVQTFLAYETDLFTDESRVRLKDSGSVAESYLRVPSPMYSGYHELRPPRIAPPLGLSNPMLPVIDDAISSIEDDRAMLCTVADAVEVHKVIDGIQRSLAEGTWIRLT